MALRAGVSNLVVCFLNFIVLLAGITILATGIWLATKHSSDCVRFLETPMIVIGVIMVVISLVGIAGALLASPALLAAYLFVMFLVILTLFSFTLFAFVVTNGGDGHSTYGKAYKEFRFGDYSDWLRNTVENHRKWRLIKSCLSDTDVCGGLKEDYPTLEAFNAADLSPLESGCCKPPLVCGYVFRSATNWTTPLNRNADPDCGLWNNKDLCFNCNSCKAGLLQQVKNHWRMVAIINAIVLAVVILAYSIALCAFRAVRK